MEQIFLSVVIPAYNESRKIAADLDQAESYLRAQSYAYEIIVVDDGSTDGTADVVQEISTRNSRIRVIRQPHNRGKGAAVRAGMQAARGEFALFADAGTCVPYTNVGRGLDILKNGADMAYGSRAVLQAHIRRRQPLYRRLGSRAFHHIVFHCLGLTDISDTQCGFKLFKRRAYLDIFNNLVTDGFMFDSETFLYAIWRGYSVREFPVEWSNDPDTRFKPFGGSIRNFRELMAIKRRIRLLQSGKIVPV